MEPPPLTFSIDLSAADLPFHPSMAIRVFLLALLLFASPFLQVVRCESKEESETVYDGADTVGEVGDVGIVNDDAQFYADESFGSAAGVQMVCVFPKNPGKLVPAGEETELLVGIGYDGDPSVNVIAIKANFNDKYDEYSFFCIM